MLLMISKLKKKGQILVLRGEYCIFRYQSDKLMAYDIIPNIVGYSPNNMLNLRTDLLIKNIYISRYDKRTNSRLEGSCYFPEEASLTSMSVKKK